MHALPILTQNLYTYVQIFKIDKVYGDQKKTLDVDILHLYAYVNAHLKCTQRSESTGHEWGT